MNTKAKDSKESTTTESSRWIEAEKIKGSTADMRKSAASIRGQVEKESAIFTRFRVSNEKTG